MVGRLKMLTGESSVAGMAFTGRRLKESESSTSRCQSRFDRCWELLPRGHGSVKMPCGAIERTEQPSEN
jgi:hypothetical protein